MDYTMLLKFPGILILVGVLLLIIALIMGIIAYKKPTQSKLNNDYEDERNEKIDMSQAKIEIKPVIKEEIEITKEVEPIIKEEPKFEELKKEAPIEEVNIDQPIDFEEEEQKTIEPSDTKIYGGYNPADKIEINFPQDKKVLYGDEKLSDLPDLDEIIKKDIETQPIKEIEEKPKEIKEEIVDEIEVL